MNIHDACTDQDALLNSFGTRMVSGRFAVFDDLAKADNAYVHHTAVPVAVTTFATISASFARGRFPDVTLADVVLKRPYMDRREAAALAAVCGERISSAPDPDARDFSQHLLEVIDRRDLHAFYGRYPEHPADYGIDVRPHGIDWQTHDTDDVGIRAWRKAYKELEAADQIMVATIMWLYVGREQNSWLWRVPYRWHAADAVKTLKDAGTLGDWAKLVALYQGW